MVFMWQEVTDKTHWNKLVSSQLHARFLQSWAWGEFQASLGRKVLRLAWNDEVFVQVIKMNLPGGFAYCYIPHGPVVLDKAELDSQVFSELAKTLGGNGALFLRVDPLSDISVEARITPSTQPRCVRILDLTKTEAEILANLHPKTRYNINLAARQGVAVGAGNIEEFLRLNRETTARYQFASHPDVYYRAMVKTLDNNFVKVWQATRQNKVLASALVFYFGDTAAYTHGASASQDRNLMAPYLLHWEIIKGAKNQGFGYYDLGGVNPTDEKSPAFKKSWQGITRFKQGFGGEVVCNPPSFDLIYRPNWYSLYRLSSAIYRIFL